MSTVLGQRGLAEGRARWMPWLAVAIGLAALYVPTYVSLAGGLWRDDDYAHGPIILAVFAWLVWRSRAVLAEPARPAPMAGAILLFAGLVLYVLGRTLSLTVFEVASHMPVVAGLVLMLRGVTGLRRLAFPILFLFFLIPLPGFVLDWLAAPLKTVVSILVSGFLQVLGYPVERSGVVLELGDHQMLVADACSGLNSIYSLAALGLLYAWLTPPRTFRRVAILLAAILPIAIVANVVRVTALVLITYHLGDDAQASFHGFAGILVFVVALALLVAVDSWLKLNRGQIPVSASSGSDPNPEPVRGPADPRVRGLTPSITFGLASTLLFLAAATSWTMKPVPVHDPIDLEQAIPARFGEWQVDPTIEPITPAPDVQAKLDRIYRQVVSRTYVNASGERMMLTIAHGGDQSDALKAHRQEKCYEAQGFEIAGLAHGRLAAAKRDIPVTRMVAVRGERVEPVTYWFTMGDRVVLGRAERLRVQVASGLAGRIPDGMLVRVSNLSTDPDGAFAAQQAFAAAIFGRVDPAQAARFVGTAKG